MSNSARASHHHSLRSHFNIKRQRLLSELPHTKIVCTIGPASSSPKMIAEFIDAGMNVARLNFSHGEHFIHAQNIQWIREISAKKQRPVAILQDLQGPKIRTGKLIGGSMILVSGQKIILRYGVEQTETNIIPIDFENLIHDIAIGNRILLDDGLLGMKVVDIQNHDVHCEVIHGGILKSRKGVNFPHCKLSIPATTEKDIKDLQFGLEQGVDYIALSFVQTADDIHQLRNMIRSLGHNTPIISKIEMMSAVENIDSICAISDGIMVARGDLGVECGFAHVASFQKQIIEAALKAGKPIIVATQMLDSMITSRRPTKAEICDVSNAVFDHADATMLSGESASGDYPLVAVKTMRDILDRVDNSCAVKPLNLPLHPNATTTELFAYTTVELANKINATAILSLTLTGHIVQLLAKYRPNAPIIAFSTNQETVRRLSLFRGVWSVSASFTDTEKVFNEIVTFLISKDYVKKGDILLITGCVTTSSQMKQTNTLKMHRV